MSNRYERGDQPIPVLLQDRDLRILASIFRHRWLRVEHVQALHFPQAGLRATRERLRRLWAARLLDREFLTLIVGPGIPREAYAGSAIYCLARNGAGIVADELEIPVERIPHTLKTNRRGYVNLRHNLVATDFFVALEVAAAGQPDLCLLSIERESELWTRLRAAGNKSSLPRAYVVPDGTFTLAPTDAITPPTTFYLEIVRVDPKGGNSAFARKLKRYAELNRQGWFRETYSHPHVRAVIMLTPTDERAENLRRHADKLLVHGRHLFWFGSYERVDANGKKTTSLTAATILSARFASLDGAMQSIVSALHS